MTQFTIIQQICIWALPVLFGITLHEAAHAYVAYRCGDTTAKMFGRLSLNPLKHVDPVGTVLLPLLIGFLTNFNFIFGYAKPVPINPAQFHNPRRDTLLVGIAGPVSNFIMAILWAACLKIGMLLNPQSSVIALFMIYTGQAGILINLILAFLNLIPIPPLDGSRVVSSLLPAKQSIAYSKIEPYGFFILIILLLTGVLSAILTPLIRFTFAIISAVFNL